MRLRFLQRTYRKFSYFKSLNTLINEMGQTSDPSKALQTFTKDPSPITFHTALLSLYKRLELNPSQTTQLPSLISFINHFQNQNSRSLNEIFLCKFPKNPHPTIKQLYFHQLSKYINTYQAIDIEYYIYFFVLQISSHFVFGDKMQTLDSEGEEEPEFIKNAFADFTNKYCEVLYLFDLQSKISITRMCKSLRIYNVELLEHLKTMVQAEYQHMTLTEVLVVLAYLTDAKTLPYEFFYAQKQKWLNMINKYGGNLQRRSEGPLLRLFQILAKGNLVYTARIIEQIIKIFKKNLRKLEVVSLIRVIYYYSKVRYQDNELVEQIINLLTKEVSEVNKRSLKYMIMALGNLKYNEVGFIKRMGQNKHFFESLELGAAELETNKDYYKEIVQIIKSQ